MPRKKSTKSNVKTKKGGRKGGISVMATGAGMAVGAALGAAAGAILADEQRRDKIVNKAQVFSSQAVDAIEDVTHDAKKWKENAYESLEGAQDNAERKVATAKKAIKKS